MEKLEKLITRYWFFIILIFFIPAVWALFVKGYFGASDDLHVAWLYELDRAIKLGQIPPRFVPDLSFGFGYPLFNFVFPLPFYIGEIFHLLGLTLVDSVKAVLFVSIPISGIFMYLLLREFTKSRFAFVGAMLYIYAPYRAVDIYVRGAIGEALSFIFLPLVILAIVKLKSSKHWKWAGLGAISVASLVLSHNIAAYMFFPFVIVFFFLQFFSTAAWKAFFLRLFLMFFLGFLISIYFWLPALLESSLLKYDTVFNFFDHFPTVRQLVTPYWGYGGSVPGPGDGMSFFLGGANLLVFVTAGLLLIFKWKVINRQNKLLMIWVISALATAIFLMNYRSTFVWNNLPLLPYFQFPWRFLILVTFFIPLLVVIFEKFKYEKALLLLIMAFIIFPTWTFFRPEDFLGREDGYYLNRYIPIPSASSEYLKTQEEYLRLPKATEIRPDKNFPLLFPENGIRRVDKINDLKVAFEFVSDKGELINLNKYYFPGWQARIDGKSVEIFAGKPFGQVSIFVPAGSHKAEVYFQETSFRKFLNFASLGAFLVSLMMLLI
ncbi:hypothetical protein HYS96_02240 [Candidatus Daviesbacteria bacterium]|nr:hypothetical protein [Candidatus Daviesbacteria bacterium]